MRVWCCCVAPRVFRAPSGLTRWAGRFVCPWAAARPQAVRAAALRSAPASPRSPARPRHRPRAPQPGLRSPGPSRQWGRVADVWLYASPRSLARPRHRPRAPPPGSPNPNVVWLVVLGFWALRCVIYKRRQSDGFSPENQCFWTQIDDVCNRGPREACESRWFDDVCNIWPPTGRPARPCLRPRALWSGSADQAARLSETAVAFARWYSCGVETAAAFARSCSCGLKPSSPLRVLVSLS